MIDCTAAVRQLWDYIEGEIEPRQGTRIEEHLAFCRRCCGELEFAEEMRRFMLSRPTSEIPPQVRRRLEDLVDELEADGVS